MSKKKTQTYVTLFFNERAKPDGAQGALSRETVKLEKIGKKRSDVHQYARDKKKISGYQIYDIVTLRDANDKKQRTGPVNKSKEVYFGDIKKGKHIDFGQAAKLPSIPLKEKEKDKWFVFIDDGPVERLYKNHEVYDRKSNKQLWPK